MSNTAATSPSTVVRCPVCRGTGRNPAAPAALADDDGTCLVCCFPLHPWYTRAHGQVRVPVAVAVAASEAQLRALGLTLAGDDVSQ